MGEPVKANNNISPFKTTIKISAPLNMLVWSW